MTFGAPEWFWAFALLPVLGALFFWNGRRSAHLIAQVVAPRLRQQLAGNVSAARRSFRFLILLLALACVIVSLAQPRLGFTWEQSKRKGRDIIIAVDTSRSMLATDLPPNRLARVKLAAQDLIGLLGGDRVGLIAFAGTAFLQAPLTVDYGSVLTSLRELDTNIIPRGGTNIAAAISTAAEAFGKGESENRCLIIFTDGEELDADGVEAARKLGGECRIFTVGAGTAEGSIIPIPGQNGGTEFVKDSAGRIVKSRMDEPRLREIAEATGGFYLVLQSGAAEMRQLFENGISPMQENDIDARTSRRPIERYQWPLGAGIILLMISMGIGDRKRRAATAVTGGKVQREAATAALFLLVSFSTGTAARNSAVELYQGKDYEGAYQEFKKQVRRNQGSEALHFGLGAAAYQKGNYDEALQEFSTAVRSEDQQLRALAEYNLGNTLYQQAVRHPAKEPQLKSLKNALQHYEEALKLRSKDENARFNRDLVAEMIRKLEEEPPKQDQEQSKEKQEPPPEEKKSGEKNKDQQKGDQKKSQPDDQQKGDQSESEKEQEQGKQPEQSGQSGTDPKQNQKQPGADDKENQPEQSEAGGDKKQENQKDGSEKEQERKSPSQTAGQTSDDPDERRENSAKGTPAQPERKLDGKVEAQPSTPGEEAAAELQPDAVGDDGKMTEMQARALIESMKGEDDRVPLIERKGSGATLKDW